MLNLGRLDRSGILYSVTPTPGVGGAIRYTRTRVCNLYLSKVDIPTRTRLLAQKDSEQTDAVFMSRWFDGLVNGMILVVEGHEYRITARDELGRREGWKIYGRATS